MSREIDIVQNAMAHPPVDVERVIQDLGVEFRREPLAPGKSGYIEARDGRYIIVVNSHESPQRQRFTAAHELAHYLLHRQMLGQDGTMNRHDDILWGRKGVGNPPQPFAPANEVEANRLAASIIMPAGTVRALYDASRDNVSELMETFHVSRSAMEVRLRVLGLR